MRQNLFLKSTRTRRGLLQSNSPTRCPWLWPFRNYFRLKIVTRMVVLRWLCLQMLVTILGHLFVRRRWKAHGVNYQIQYRLVNRLQKVVVSPILKVEVVKLLLLCLLLVRHISVIIRISVFRHAQLYGLLRVGKARWWWLYGAINVTLNLLALQFFWCIVVVKSMLRLRNVVWEWTSLLHRIVEH